MEYAEFSYALAVNLRVRNQKSLDTRGSCCCSHGDFYTIIDLPEGTHQYKFYVDGHWVCDDNAVSTRLHTYKDVF